MGQGSQGLGQENQELRDGLQNETVPKIKNKTLTNITRFTIIIFLAQLSMTRLVKSAAGFHPQDQLARLPISPQTLPDTWQGWLSG